MSNTNPLLAGLKLPGRIFQLPSKGIFYKNGELGPDSKEGEIHVKPMSALDEINMKNPDQLFSGEAVNTVFAHCIEGISKPSELLAKDIDAIMLFLRTVTYGPEYEFTARHSCKNLPEGQESKDHSYTTNIDTMINEMVMMDESKIEEEFTLNLTNGQVVKLRPNRYEDVVSLIKANQNKTEFTPADQQANLANIVRAVIESVNSNTDDDNITEWISKLPSPIINRIAEKVEKINNWGSNLTCKCKCRDCGEEFPVEIPINPVTFFTE